MDWEAEKKARTKRFWLGVFAGFLAAVFLLAGAWSVWQLSGLGNNGDFASNSISEEDVEDVTDTCSCQRAIRD